MVPHSSTLAWKIPWMEEAVLDRTACRGPLNSERRTLDAKLLKASSRSGYTVSPKGRLLDSRFSRLRFYRRRNRAAARLQPRRVEWRQLHAARPARRRRSAGFAVHHLRIEPRPIAERPRGYVPARGHVSGDRHHDYARQYHRKRDSVLREQRANQCHPAVQRSNRPGGPQGDNERLEE